MFKFCTKQGSKQQLEPKTSLLWSHSAQAGLEAGERGDVLAPPSPAPWQSQAWKLGCTLHPVANMWQGGGDSSGTHSQSQLWPWSRAGAGAGPAAGSEAGAGAGSDAGSCAGARPGSGADSGIGPGAGVGTNASAGAQLGQAQILFSLWHFVFLKRA